MYGGAFTEIDLSNKQCDDLVMGTEELIPTFLALSQDNIVFKQPESDNYLCSSREDIKKQMSDPANLVLPCTASTFALNITPNMVCGLKMSKLQALGVAYGGYVPLENIVDVVANSTEQIFQIEDYDSPITVKAIAGLRLFPEYAPEEVRVPFYPKEDENNDSYVRRLNEWGAQNNQPNIGDRWEDASQLLLGATHCQSGYEGQHIFRIVSSSNPEYRINPRLLQRMKETGCIMADYLPTITDIIPQIDWESEYLYQDTAEYTPARRLFGFSMEEDKDIREQFSDLLSEQLGRNRVLSIDENISQGETQTLSFYGDKTEDIFRTINQSSTNDVNEIMTNSYLLAITSPGEDDDSNIGLTYMTNIDGTYTASVDGHPNIIVMNIDNDTKRKNVYNILKFMNDNTERRTEQIEEFVDNNNNELTVDVDLLKVIVATIRPVNNSNRDENTRVISIIASDLLKALELNQAEWEQWYYKNVVERSVNNNQTASPNNIILYDFSIVDENTGINVETSIWNPTAGSIIQENNYTVDIGYLEIIKFPVLDNVNFEGVETQIGQTLSPIASPSTSPLASPSMSPISINDFTPNSSSLSLASEPSTPDFSGGKKRHQTKSKRGRKGKKVGKVKQTRRRKNNRNK